MAFGPEPVDIGQLDTLRKTTELSLAKESTGSSPFMILCHSREGRAVCYQTGNIVIAVTLPNLTVLYKQQLSNGERILRSAMSNDGTALVICVARVTRTFDRGSTEKPDYGVDTEYRAHTITDLGPSRSPKVSIAKLGNGSDSTYINKDGQKIRDESDLIIMSTYITSMPVRAAIETRRYFYRRVDEEPGQSSTGDHIVSLRADDSQEIAQYSLGVGGESIGLDRTGRFLAIKVAPSDRDKAVNKTIRVSDGVIVNKAARYYGSGKLPEAEAGLAVTERITTLHGRGLVLGSNSGVIRIVDKGAPSEPLRTILDHKARISVLARNPQGPGFISMDSDGKVIIWRADPFEVVNLSYKFDENYSRAYRVEGEITQGSSKERLDRLETLKVSRKFDGGVDIVTDGKSRTIDMFGNAKSGVFRLSFFILPTFPEGGVAIGDSWIQEFRDDAIGGSVNWSVKSLDKHGSDGMVVLEFKRENSMPLSEEDGEESASGFLTYDIGRGEIVEGSQHLVRRFYKKGTKEFLFLYDFGMKLSAIKP